MTLARELRSGNLAEVALAHFSEFYQSAIRFETFAVEILDRRDFVKLSVGTALAGAECAHDRK
jgi:hypothetical protein